MGGFIINDVLDGLCFKISENFDDAYEIYVEKMEQGVVKPCFFIRCIECKNDRFLGKRFRYSYKFSIQFYGDRADSYFVSEVLQNKLEFIVVDGELIRGKVYKVFFENDILNTEYSCEWFKYKEEIDYKMDNLEFRGVSNGE